MLDGGTYNAKLYHLTNLVLHSICSVLSLVTFQLVFKEIRPRLSLVSALLFAIHPVHTEAVAGIVGRADLLCGIFYFLSIYNYARHIKSGSCARFVLSMICCGVAMLCKEQGITVLGVLAVYDLVAGNHFNLRRMQFMTGKAVRRFLWMTLVGLLLLYGRLSVMGSTPPAFQKVDNPASFAEAIQTRIMSYNYVYSIHALLLLWPHWLCFDWSMGCIPLIHHWTDPRNASAVLFWILFLSAAFKALLSHSAIQRRYLTVGLSLIAVPFLPATNLFFRVGFVVAERVLFVPVAGYCLIVVYGLEKLNAIYPRVKV